MRRTNRNVWVTLCADACRDSYLWFVQNDQETQFIIKVSILENVHTKWIWRTFFFIYIYNHNTNYSMSIIKRCNFNATQIYRMYFKYILVVVYYGQNTVMYTDTIATAQRLVLDLISILLWQLMTIKFNLSTTALK